MMNILDFFKDNNGGNTSLGSYLLVSVILGITDLLILSGHINAELPNDFIHIKISAPFALLIFCIPFIEVALLSLAISLAGCFTRYYYGHIPGMILGLAEKLFFLYTLYNVLTGIGIIYADTSINELYLQHGLKIRGIFYSFLFLIYIIFWVNNSLSSDLGGNLYNTYNFQFRDKLTEQQQNEILGKIIELLYDEFTFVGNNKRTRMTRKIIEENRYIEFYDNGFLIGLAERPDLSGDFSIYMGRISKYLSEMEYQYKVTLSHENLTLNLLANSDDMPYIRITK